MAAFVALAAPSAEAAGEPHSAHQFASEPQQDLTDVSVELEVEPIDLGALKFFALQVTFPNGVAAHGGPQALSGAQKVNWGALTSNSNYAYDASTPTSVRLAALEQMQNAPVRTDDFAWSPNVWYRLDVTRGASDSLPAGNYSVLDEPTVYVDHARTMRAWTFTVSRADTGAALHTQTLHVAADTIQSFMYWTETGYGVTCTDKIRVHWRRPRFTSAASGEGAPTKIVKSIGQSTCDATATTDIQVETPNVMGTLQTFGEPRPATSHDGDVLYPIPGGDAGGAGGGGGADGGAGGGVGAVPEADGGGGASHDDAGSSGCSAAPHRLDAGASAWALLFFVPWIARGSKRLRRA